MLSEASEIISLEELPNPAYSNATHYKAVVTPRPWGLSPCSNTTAAGRETSPSPPSTQLAQAWEALAVGWASRDLPHASDETSGLSNLGKLPPRQCSVHDEDSTALSQEVFWGGRLSDEWRVNAKKRILFFCPLQPPIEFNLSALRCYHCAADAGTTFRRLVDNAGGPAGSRPGCRLAELCRDGQTDTGQPNRQGCVQSLQEDPTEEGTGKENPT